MITTKKLLILLLFSVPLVITAQEKKSVSQVGLNYSVDYCYRVLDSDASVQWIADDRNDSEIGVIGFNAGATYSYQFKKGLMLEAGFQFTRVGEQYKSITFTTSQGDVGEGRFANYYDYAGIPIKIGYGLQLGKRLRLSIMSGISTNFFLARQVRSTVNYYDGTTENFSSTYSKEPFGTQFENVNVVSVSSLGIDIRVFRAFSLRFEPTFRYSITPIMDAPIKQRPYSAGFNTTVFYSFGSKKKVDSKEAVAP
ncbi:MAG: outer membrane beta-barrel protein [Fluviicola sp.]|nr:outer membrane beta-barrel protein [Fluviicola sp.]